MTSNPIRLGIIGLGLITQSRHLPNLSRLTDLFTITHVCDLSPTVAADIAADTGATRWGTNALDVLSNENVDAVMICTPGAHSSLGRSALEHGKHVFAEKPYAYDPQLAHDDAQYAAKHGLILQVGYMKMLEPAVARAREMLDELGTLRLIRVTVLHPSDENQTSGLSIRRGGDVDPDALRLAQEENRLEVAGAMQGCSSTDAALVRNVLFGSVCHEVALLRALLPESEFSVNSAIADAPAAQRTEPPRLQITGTTSQGPRWSLSWNWVPDYPSYQEWVELVGDKGSLRIDMPAPYGGIPSAVLTSFTGSASGATEQVWTPTTLDAFHTELEEFARAVSTGSPVTATASGAAKDAELLLNIADVLAASDLA